MIARAAIAIAVGLPSLWVAAMVSAFGPAGASALALLYAGQMLP